LGSDPVLIAYSARRAGKKVRWTRIGSAYPHDKGSGLTVVLEVIPLDGRIILLELGDDDDRRLAVAARTPEGPATAKSRSRR
jgi:hypothetical protein